MKLKTVEITELKGINRNAVEGVTQMQPVSLTGVNFDRGGGYLKVNDGDSPITLSGTFAGTVVGNDDRGYVTLGSISGSSIALSFYDGSSTVYTQSGTAVSPVDGVSDYYHFQGAGAVGNLELTGAVYYRTVHLITKSGVHLDGNDFESGAPDVTLFGPTTTSNGTLDSSGTYRYWIFRSVNTTRGQFWVPTGQTGDNTLSSSENAFQVTWDFNTSSSVETDTDVLVYLQETTSASSPRNVPATLVAVSQEATISLSDPLIIESMLGTQIGGPPAVIQFDGTAVFHRQRFYGKPSALGPGTTALYMAASFGSTADAPDTSIATKSKLSIVYSAMGTVNAWQPDQYFVAPFSVSKEITGLASSPAGLLVFGDSETFLVRGDPALPDSFAVQLASGVIGMDDNTQPVRLGGTVFVIYKGEIYAYSLGMGDVDFGSGIQKLSDPVYDPDDPFTQIATAPNDRFLVAMTATTGFTFDAEKQEWLTNSPIDTRSPDNIFSNPDSDGVRYYTSSNSRLYSVSGGAFYFAEVQYRDVDVGEKHVKKLWRRVRINMNDDFSGNVLVDYNANGTSGTITASNEGEGAYVATLPSGLVSTKIDLELRPGMAAGDTIEPPITLEFVPRYKRR